MIYIETGSVSPAVNLAYEEYFFKKAALQDDAFMLWQDEPAVVIGRFQNIWGEVDLAYAQEHQIQVLRRISGGGAVYHDLGNLCFTFIVRGIAPGDLDPPRYTRLAQAALVRLGIPAETNERNDLLLEGKKIGGTAMALQKGRLLFHGTLLFDSHLDWLRAALSAPAWKVESPGTQSRRSAVTTIRSSSRVFSDMAAFKQGMKKALFEDQPVVEHAPAPAEAAEILALAGGKYRGWEWNYGANPAAKIEMVYPFPEGELSIRLDTNRGEILSAAIADTRYPGVHFAGVASRLEQVRYDRSEIEKAFEGIAWSPELCPIPKAEMLRYLMGSGPRRSPDSASI